MEQCAGQIRQNTAWKAWSDKLVFPLTLRVKFMPRPESYLLVGPSHVLRAPQKDFVNMYIAKMHRRMSQNVMVYSVPIVLAPGVTFIKGDNVPVVGTLTTPLDAYVSLVASPL